MEEDEDADGDEDEDQDEGEDEDADEDKAEDEDEDEDGDLIVSQPPLHTVHCLELKGRRGRLGGGRERGDCHFWSHSAIQRNALCEKPRQPSCVFCPAQGTARLCWAEWVLPKAQEVSSTGFQRPVRAPCAPVRPCGENPELSGPRTQQAVPGLSSPGSGASPVSHFGGGSRATLQLFLRCPCWGVPGCPACGRTGVTWPPPSPEAEGLRGPGAGAICTGHSQGRPCRAAPGVSEGLAQLQNQGPVSRGEHT